MYNLAVNATKHDNSYKESIATTNTITIMIIASSFCVRLPTEFNADIFQLTIKSDLPRDIQCRIFAAIDVVCKHSQVDWLSRKIQTIGN